MPSRLLREGILDSDRVDKLSLGAEVFYRRLMSVVDDFGLFDGRLSVLKSRLYPLRHHRVSERDVTQWLLECESARLIRQYTVDGKQYIQFFDLGSIQRSKPKYPLPPESARNGLQPQTGAPGSGTSAHSGTGASSAPPEKSVSPRKSKGREAILAGMRKGKPP